MSRRVFQIRRCLIAFVPMLLLLNGELTADDQVSFKGHADLLDTVQIARGFSDDKQAVTVLFRNLQVVVETNDAEPVAIRTVTLELPVESAKKGFKIIQDVRGYVDLADGAAAVLLVRAGGMTTVVNLTEQPTSGIQPTAAIQQSRSRAKSQADILFDQSDPPTSSVDFFQRIESDIPAQSRCYITFVLLVERQREGDNVAGLLVVDSLDVTFHGAADDE